MAKKTTSLAFETAEELLELKSDAIEAGMDVSKYLRKLAKDKREERKSNITNNDTPKTTNNNIKINQVETVVGMDTMQSKEETKKEIKYNVEIPKINEVKKMAETGLTEAQIEAIAEKTSRKVNEEDKLKDLINKVYDKQCEGEDCLNKLKNTVNELEQIVKKPEPKKWKCSGKEGCGEDTLIEGMPFCPNCGRKVNWVE